MKPFCDALQERLASDGPQAMAHDAVFRDQVQQCEDCRAFALALARVDAGLERLEPVSAPLQAQAARARFAAKSSQRAAAVQSAASEPKPPSGDPVRRGLPAALAVSVVITALIGLFSGETYRLTMADGMTLYSRSPSVATGIGGGLASTRPYESTADQERLLYPLSKRLNQPSLGADPSSTASTAVAEAAASIGDQSVTRQAPAPVPSTPGQDNDAPRQAIAMEFAQAAQSLNTEDRFHESAPSLQGQSTPKTDAPLATPALRSNDASSQIARDGLSSAASSSGAEQQARMAEETIQPEKVAGQMQDEPAQLRKSATLKADRLEALPPPSPMRPAAQADGQAWQASKYRAEKSISSAPANRAADVMPAQGLEAQAKSVRRQRQRSSQTARRKASPRIEAEQLQQAAAQRLRTAARSGASGQLREVDRPVRVAAGQLGFERAHASAQAFLSERERTSNLRFQDPRGYWRNTYIPGDPGLRLLQAQLQAWDRTAIRTTIPGALLETGVRRNAQPFDVPSNAALATFLQADKSAVSGPARLRLQLGLQASRRQGGTRPSMNVALVLDLRKSPDAGSIKRMRGLVDALLRAKLAGDRFSLTVAYPGGGLHLTAKHFRHGPLALTMQALSGLKPLAALEAIGATPVRLPDLHAALVAAADGVRQSAEPESPLGASMVLLAVAASIADEQASLQSLVHQMAVDGIVTSVVALGDVPLDEIDRLVVYGHGNRRILAKPGDAALIVDRELHAVSRVVARVLRLNIKLNPQVKLVSVLGSQPLSKLVAERVREAERSVDLKVARSLGIAADRGKDEAGIQIVIPAFLAGDHHVVILDVLVPGPGPVAEVAVRYKDLVSRRNGVSRAYFELVSGQDRMGPLELNVIKNQLALHFAEQITLASQALTQNRYEQVRQRLVELRLLLAGMRLSLRGLASDEDLLRDEQRLAEFIALSVNPVAQAEQLQLANAMRYAARAKLQATP